MLRWILSASVLLTFAAASFAQSTHRLQDGITAFVKEPGESLSRVSHQANHTARAVIQKAKTATPHSRMRGRRAGTKRAAARTRASAPKAGRNFVPVPRSTTAKSLSAISVPPSEWNSQSSANR